MGIRHVLHQHTDRPFPLKGNLLLNRGESRSQISGYIQVVKSNDGNVLRNPDPLS